MLQAQSTETAGVESAPTPSPLPMGNAAAPSYVLHVLQNITDEVRSILGVHQAVTRITVDETWEKAESAISLSQKFAACDIDRSELDCLGPMVPVSAPMRMTHQELIAHPAWASYAGHAGCRPPLQGWLAAPLFNSRGRVIGMIEATDKEHGEFTAADEARLVSFARIAALAIENAWLYHASGDSDNAVAAKSDRGLESEIGKLLLKDGDLAVLLQECADIIIGKLGFAVGRIWAAHASVLEVQATAGLSLRAYDERGCVPAGQFSIGRVAQRREPYLSNAMLHDPLIHGKDWCRREGLSAFAGVPLVCEMDLQGVLAVYDRKPISPQAFETLVALAPLIGMAIRRQRSEDDRDPVPDPAGSPLVDDARPEHAVIVTTVDGVIVDWNDAAQRCFGYARSEIVGRPFSILVPPDCAEQHREIMTAVARHETISRAETIRLRKGGDPVRVSLTASGLHDTSGHLVGAVTVFHDLADITRLELQFQQAQKMEVFGQLAGGVAHDFNNLLTIILGYTEIIIGRLTPSDSIRELLGEIQKASRRAETLTRQLLAFSRKQTLEPKVLDLNAALSDTEKMLRRLIGEDILMTTILAPSLKFVKIDPGHLQQVVLNLAVNARDAMPRGGHLTLETDNVHLDRDHVHRHPNARAGEYVALTVRDTGTGMSDVVKARAFEPHFTTKAPGKGTGLGLSTVESIVRRAGGHIEVESQLGLGSTFKVYFPALVEALPMHKSNPALRTIPRGTETVLLVEDEDPVRSLVRQVLLTCGYTVLDATDGQEALQMAEAHGGTIHLLVSDVVMPHLSGRPLADRLLAVQPNLKVLFLSGYTNDAMVRHGVADTEFAFLQKPFSTSALAQKVREVLDQPALRVGA